MKKQGGFTLIELVVVIVILGILAVTAAPRFLNLQSDARGSSLEGLRGAIAGATGIVYGGSAIAGEETLGKTQADGENNTPPESNGVTTHFGYPTANSAGIEVAVTGLPGSDWVALTTVPNTPDNSVVYSFVGTTPVTTGNAAWNATSGSESGCFVIYTEPVNAGDEPNLESATNNC